MSIKTFIASILHPTSGTVIGRIELSLVAHAVAIAKADKGLVGKIEAQIEAVAKPAQPMTGAQKRDAVVAAVASDALEFVGDPTKAIADVTDFAHELVQSVFDDATSSTAGTIAALIVAKAA
ncbi:hypothetical protein [Sphingomonas abietis]|uniref:Uncharacterized protein n=1 Tax=Sphingomonas abietis TaxID=3012344 RepID=A0ABY7NTM6_9SPHN|nr:hypothetical protein [Sphingomonas abietis]WBO23917.1 hypothetical protein PBT88_07355 [Sphingomonas abietis]